MIHKVKYKTDSNPNILDVVTLSYVELDGDDVTSKFNTDDFIHTDTDEEDGNPIEEHIAEVLEIDKDDTEFIRIK